MDPQHTRQVLELLFPSAVLDEILTRHAHPDKNASMQQLLNNMYPEHVQALLFSRLKQTGGCNDHQNSQTQHGECSKGHSRQHQQAASTSRFEIEQEPVENQQEAFAQAWDLRFPPPTENAFGYWISQAQTKTDQFAAAVFVLLASTSYVLVAKNVAPQYGLIAWLQMVPSLLITILLGVAVPFAHRTAPMWYTTHREPLIAVLRALNVLQVLVHKRIFPWVHTQGTLPLVLLVSSGTLPLAAPAIRHRVRFSLHIKLHSILSLLCAVSVLAHANGVVLRAQQGLLSVFLAWAVPSVVVYWIEAQARRAFVSNYHQRVWGGALRVGGIKPSAVGKLYSKSL